MLNRNLLLCAFAIMFLAACGDSKSGKESSIASKEIVSSKPPAEDSLKLFSERDIGWERFIEIDSGGYRSKKEVIKTAYYRMAGPRNIYEKYLKLKPDFEGNITLKFTIAPSGNIAEIYIISSTTGYGEFDNAIESIVKTWRWQAIEGGNTTVTIPFDFSSIFLPIRHGAYVDIGNFLM